MFHHFVKDSDGVNISGPLILVPKVFNDTRGFFLEKTVIQKTLILVLMKRLILYKIITPVLIAE